MTNINRRRFLAGLLGSLTGTVVLASTTSSADQPPTPEPQPQPPADIQERADQLANAAETQEQEVPVSAFVNGAFRNGTGGGFRNGGFANGGGGGFRNGGFRNGAGGGFRNGAFRNW